MKKRKVRGSIPHLLFDFYFNFFFSDPLLFLSLLFICIFLLILAKKGCVKEGGWGFPLFLSIARGQQWLRTREGLEKLFNLDSLLYIERLHCRMQFFSNDLSNRLEKISSSFHCHVNILLERFLNLVVNVKALWGHICQCNGFGLESNTIFTHGYFFRLDIKQKKGRLDIIPYESWSHGINIAINDGFDVVLLLAGVKD